MSEQIIATVIGMSDRLFNIAYRIVCDRETALDLVQELALKVLERPESFRASDNPEPYLLKTILNMALNRRRNLLRRGEQSWEEEHGGISSSPEDETVCENQTTLLMEALDQLSDRQREALLLRFFADKTIVEAAEVMRIGVSSVKVHLARGLMQLRRAMKVTIKRR